MKRQERRRPVPQLASLTLSAGVEGGINGWRRKKKQSSAQRRDTDVSKTRTSKAEHEKGAKRARPAVSSVSPSSSRGFQSSESAVDGWCKRARQKREGEKLELPLGRDSA